MSQIFAARFFSSLDDLLGRLGHRHAGRESDAAAAGQDAEADRSGVGDDRADLLVRDAEHLGRHHRHRGARAADIGVALDDADGAVLVDVHGGARLRRRC